MAYLTFFFYALAFLSLWRKGSVTVGPVFLIAFYSFISIFVFYLNDSGLVYFEPYRGLPLAMYGDYTDAIIVYMVASGFAFVCLIINLKLKSQKVKHNPQFFLKQLAYIRNKPSFNLINYLVLGSLVVLYVFNIYETNYDLIFSNTAYLYITGPQNVGISSPVGKILYHLTGPGGMVYAFMLTYYFKVKRFDFFALVFLLFMYAVFIKSSQFSRWLPLIFVGFTVAIFLLFESRKKYFFCLIFFVIALFLFIIVLKGRGGFEQGYYGFVFQIQNFSFAQDAYYELSKLLVNVFGGYIVMAESLDVGWAYDFGYILRSFSPLPSFIDGWGSHVENVGRVNLYTPFNSLTEIYFFGKWAILATFLFFSLTIYRIEHINRNYASSFSMLAFVVFIYVFLASFYYPTRNVFRIYLICLILYEFSAYIMKKLPNEKKVGQVKFKPQKLHVNKLR